MTATKPTSKWATVAVRKDGTAESFVVTAVTKNEVRLYALERCGPLTSLHIDELSPHSIKRLVGRWELVT